MKLRVTSLGKFVARDEEVASLRAEDASGSFGILPGHADFLTVLEVGIVTWRNRDGHEHHCAVLRGVLRVSNGDAIDVASREAIMDDDLMRLESTVLAEFRRRDDVEKISRTETQRLELQVLREFTRYLQPQEGSRRGQAQ